MKIIFRANSSLTRISVCIFGLLTSFEIANATRCSLPTAAKHIARTEIIFYGKVDDKTVKKKSGKIEYTDFKVLRTYKGQTSSSVTVKFHNDFGANMGWGFKKGQSLLIFADPLYKDATFIVVDGKAIYAPNYAKTNLVSVSYCSMVTFHGRPGLHSRYWEILNNIEKGPR